MPKIPPIWELNTELLSIFSTSYQITGKYELKVWNCNFVVKMKHYTMHINAHMFRSQHFSYFDAKYLENAPKLEINGHYCLKTMELAEMMTNWN